MFASSSISYAGEYCGSKTGYLNELASSFLIPDMFPPVNELLKDLIADDHYKTCSDIGFVDLAPSCMDHDSCYYRQDPKDQCDRNLRRSWLSQCKASYSVASWDHYKCRLACEYFVKLMSKAQRYDHGGFCPSCDAYDAVDQG